MIVLEIEKLQGDGSYRDLAATLGEDLDPDLSICGDREDESLFLGDRGIAEPRICQYGNLCGCGLKTLQE
jgi:hypothetical protein